MAAAKDQAKNRIDANNSWWVRQLLAADCKKAWLHPGWTQNAAMVHLYEMKKRDEEKRTEVEHQKSVSCMIRSAEGGTGLLHKVTKPTAWRRGANPLARYVEKRKE